MSINKFLSDFGKRCSLRDSFISQSEDTKRFNPKINATAGVFTINNSLGSRKSVMSFYDSLLSPESVLGYSPVLGIKELRELWRDRLINKYKISDNISLPIVTSGITSALHISGSMFIDNDSVVLYPNFHWEAYDSIFKDRFNPKCYLPYDTYLTDDISELISDFDIKTKCVIIINYPNNPTGWTPDSKESGKLINELKKICDSGRQVVAILDDAYTGLFFEPDCKGLFSSLQNLDDNLLAVKCDGASKEYLMWGLRIGFITLGWRSACEKDYEDIESKFRAVIRGTYSSSCTSSQNALIRSLLIKDPEEDKEIFDTLRDRYKKFKESIKSQGEVPYLRPLPFNSGYFMCFEVECSAEELRKRLLTEESIGIIKYNSNMIRVAWSSTDYNNIEELILKIYRKTRDIVNENSEFL